MSNVILSAIPFGILLAFTIGPVFFVLIETSITKGFKSALILDCGVVLSDIIFITIAFLSTNSLLSKIEADSNFTVFGGVLLVAYGFISFLKTSRSFREIVKEYYKVEIKKDYGLLFLKGFLLNFINIGVLLCWIAYIVLGNSISDNNHDVIAFLTTIVVVYFLIDIVKITIAKKLKKYLTPKFIFKMKKIIALVILGFGIVLLMQGFFPKEKKLIKQKLERLAPVNSEASSGIEPL